MTVFDPSIHTTLLPQLSGIQKQYPNEDMEAGGFTAKSELKTSPRETNAEHREHTRAGGKTQEHRMMKKR